MTNDQINRAIHEGIKAKGPVENYMGSFNACARARQFLTKPASQDEYMMWLRYEVGYFSAENREFAIANASAENQARALVKTVGKRPTE